MNLRFVPIAVFLLWSFICWRWYVCGIKQVCGESVALSTVVDVPKSTDQQSVSQTASDKLASDIAAIEKTKTEEPAVMPIESSKPTDEAAAIAEAAEKNEATVVELDQKTVILFPYNSLDKESSASVDEYLDRLADQLKGTAHKVTIVGHTDAIGDPETNLKFSERRAKNIRDILKAKGVRHDQIICIGKGETKPIANNDTPNGRRQNRRVEVFLSK